MQHWKVLGSSQTSFVFGRGKIQPRASYGALTATPHFLSSSALLVGDSVYKAPATGVFAALHAQVELFARQVPMAN